MKCTPHQVKPISAPHTLKGSVCHGSENDMDEVSTNEESDESPFRTVVDPDGLRNFVLPLIWTVNDFSLTIQRKHFNTLRDRYQIPVDVPIHLPHKFEKCNYCDAPNVGMYDKCSRLG